MSARYFFSNPTGGLWYHYLAFRESGSRWSSFKQNLENILGVWTPKSNHLVIVGASGGYCLPASFLARFQTLEIIEPDPVARWIFRRRFQDVLRDRIFLADAEPAFAPLYDPKALHAFFEKHSEHALLFSNLLGQLRLLAPQDPGFESWKISLRQRLSQRSDWFSFHDRVTSPQAFRLDALRPSGSLEGLIENQDFPAGTEVVDHDLNDLFEGFPAQYVEWELYPKSYHLIECVKGS